MNRKSFYICLSGNQVKRIKNKDCSNTATYDNGIPLKVTNQTDPSIQKLGHTM